MKWSHTKEFSEMQKQFEKDMLYNPSITSCDFTRVGKDERESGNFPKSVFYQNGKTNELFHVYMMGYKFGTALNS